MENEEEDNKEDRVSRDLLNPPACPFCRQACVSRSLASLIYLCQICGPTWCVCVRAHVCYHYRLSEIDF